MAAVVAGFGLVGVHGRPLALNATGCDSSDSSFDYMLLVEQLPAAFHQPGSSFTLHGMWPSRDGQTDYDSYPCACTQEQFDPSQLSSIMSEMNQYWPSYEGPNDQFWTHEWSKHGTCSKLNQLTFFQRALSARSNFDASLALKSANIQGGQSYAYDDLMRAVQTKFGVMPTLGCKGNTLTEIGICFNSDATSVMDCKDIVQNANLELGDCSHTSAITVPGPGSGPGPSPSPSGECVPDKHGPACQSDGDCKYVPGCVRCAHSGYCTTDPTQFELV